MQFVLEAADSIGTACQQTSLKQFESILIGPSADRGTLT
jgi:hypothetical protein